MRKLLAVAAGLAAVLVLETCLFGETVGSDVLVASTDDGGSLRVKNADLSLTLYSSIGYGSVTAAARLKNGNYVVGKTGGGLYELSPDLSTVVYGDDGFPAVTALAALANGYLAVGSADNYIRIKTPDLSSTVAYTGISTPQAMTGLLNGNLLVARPGISGGSDLLEFLPDLSDVAYRDEGFPTVTGLAALANGNAGVCSTDNYIRIKTPDLSMTVTYTGIGSPQAMAAQSNSNLVVARAGISGSGSDLLGFYPDLSDVPYRNQGYPLVTAIGGGIFVPEPSALSLLSTGLLGLLAYAWRKRP